MIFHPFLFGSPHGPHASAGFLGLHGWHERGQMLRAVVEGIAFNHRHHVDALREGFAPQAARLTGGISRSPVFAQLFADALHGDDRLVVGLGELAGERFRFELRGDAFNLTNTPAFNNPVTGVTDPNFMRIRSLARAPRTVQLGIRFQF